MEVNETSEVRQITTLHFGQLAVEPQHIFKFQNGLLGFEDLTEFVLISEEETAPFKWLISLQTPDIGFPLLSPWHIDISYDPGEEFDYSKHVLFVVVTLSDDNGIMTANMKAPLVFNIETQCGEQIILPSDKYSPTHYIQKKEQK